MILRFLLLTSLLPLHGALEITEFSANPNDSFLDSDGDSSDWIELQNTGATTLSTAGYSLTDDPGFAWGWNLPTLDLAPGEFLIIFASKKNRNLVGEELHSTFSLSADGEHLSLRDPA